MAPAPPSSAEFLRGAAQSFANAMQNQQESKRTAVQQQQADTEAAAQKETEKYHEGVLSQSIVRDKAALALQTAQHNLAAEQATLEFQKNPSIWSSGLPGGTQTGQTNSSGTPGTGSVPATPPLPTSKTFSLPNTSIGAGGALQPTSFTMQDPNLAAQQQAHIQSTLMQPQLQGQLALEHAKSWDEYQKALGVVQATGQNQKDVEAMRNANALQVEAGRAAASSMDAKIHAAATMGAAKLQKEGRISAAGVSSGLVMPDVNNPGGFTAFNTTPFLQRAQTGQFGQDDLAALKPAQKSLVEQTATSAGIAIPTKEQKNFIQQIPQIQRIYNLMQQNADIYSHTPAPTLLNPTSGQNQTLRDNIKEINAGLSSNVKWFTSGGRINQKQIQDIQDAYSPSLLRHGPQDQARMEQFRQLMHTNIQGNLGNFSQENRDAIIGKNSQGPVYATDPHNNNRPVVSYDGGKTAYYRDTNELVTDMGGGQ